MLQRSRKQGSHLRPLPPVRRDPDPVPRYQMRKTNMVWATEDGEIEYQWCIYDTATGKIVCLATQDRLPKLLKKLNAAAGLIDSLEPPLEEDRHA